MGIIQAVGSSRRNGTSSLLNIERFVPAEIVNECYGFEKIPVSGNDEGTSNWNSIVRPFIGDAIKAVIWQQGRILNLICLKI